MGVVSSGLLGLVFGNSSVRGSAVVIVSANRTPCSKYLGVGDSELRFSWLSPSGIKGAYKNPLPLGLPMSVI